MQWAEIQGYFRLAKGLKPFLRTTLTVAEAESSIRQWMRDREMRFLRKLERTVFEYPASPYLKLFKAGGIELQDVHRLVGQEGLEGTLSQLRDAGVYVTWEELKGRTELRRGSWSCTVQEASFNNPTDRTHYVIRSGGTSGTPVRVPVALDDHAQSAPNWAYLFHAYGWLDEPLIFWTPAHTSIANSYLRCAKFGKKYSKWFHLAGMKSFPERFRSTAVHSLIRYVGGFPAPEKATMQNLEKVSDYLFEQLSSGFKPVVRCPPSAAAALAIEVCRQGRSLQGVSFLLGAEPVTEARRRTIESAGAKAVPTYGTTEAGWVGAQFPGDLITDEVRIFRDAYAVVRQSRGGSTERQPGPLLCTSLRPAGPKVLLNAELGDAAVVEPVTATDSAAQIGYDLRMHSIRSFRKVTAWGVTLALNDLYVVLEEDLPRLFKAKVGDFQLLEEQSDNGISGLRLLVNPTVQASEEQLQRVFLDRLSRVRLYYRAMGEMLAEVGTFKIERRQPVTTVSGKVLPVVLRPSKAKEPRRSDS